MEDLQRSEALRTAEGEQMRRQLANDAAKAAEEHERHIAALLTKVSVWPGPSCSKFVDSTATNQPTNQSF